MASSHDPDVNKDKKKDLKNKDKKKWESHRLTMAEAPANSRKHNTYTQQKTNKKKHADKRDQQTLDALFRRPPSLTWSPGQLKQVTHTNF